MQDDTTVREVDAEYVRAQHRGELTTHAFYNRFSVKVVAMTTQ